MQTLLKSNETKYRLARTILQGIVGVLIANVDLMVSGLTIPPEYKAMIVALVMAILSPVMSELGASIEYEYNEDDMEDEEGEEYEPFDEIGIPTTEEGDD